MAERNCDGHGQGSRDQDPLVSTFIVETGSPWPLVFKHFGYENPHLYPSASLYKTDKNSILLMAFVYNLFTSLDV